MQTTTFSLTTARNQIFNLAEQVQTPGRYFTLVHRGQPRAVLMSAEEFEGWLETLEVLNVFPNLKKDALLAKKDYKNGNFITLKELTTKRNKK